MSIFLISLSIIVNVLIDVMSWTFIVILAPPAAVSMLGVIGASVFGASASSFTINGIDFK